MGVGVGAAEAAAASRAVLLEAVARMLCCGFCPLDASVDAKHRSCLDDALLVPTLRAHGCLPPPQPPPVELSALSPKLAAECLWSCVAKLATIEPLWTDEPRLDAQMAFLMGGYDPNRLCRCTHVCMTLRALCTDLAASADAAAPPVPACVAAAFGGGAAPFAALEMAMGTLFPRIDAAALLPLLPHLPQVSLPLRGRWAALLCELALAMLPRMALRKLRPSRGGSAATLVTPRGGGGGDGRRALRGSAYVSVDAPPAGTRRLFSLRSAHPAVWQRLVVELGEGTGDGGGGACAAPAELLEAACARPPLARDCAPFDDGSYFRPAGHFRAFYARLTADAAGAVLAIKGSEVLAGGSFDGLVGALAAHRGVEHFALKELKLPGVVSAEEALAEAEAAAAYQAAHLAAFGQLAPVPTPLAVLRWSADVERSYLARVVGKGGAATAEVRATLERLAAQQGLGVLLYHFPTPPLRVLHWLQRCEPSRSAFLQAGHAHYARALALRSPMLATLRAWVVAVARMLLLGYFPTNPLQHATGQCVQPQNMGVHGAVADLDSIAPSAAVAPADFAEFRARFWHMAVELASTATAYVAGPLYPVEPGPTGGGKPVEPSLWRVRSAVGAAVLSELREAYRTEGARLLGGAAPADERFERCFDEFLVGHSSGDGEEPAWAQY